MTAMSTPDNSISLYAELLSNIRQISLVASLAPASTPDTQAEIVDDGTVIRIRHGGHTEILALPVPASLSAALPIPEKPSTQLAWRIPISRDLAKSSSFSLENQAIPWTAADLQPSSPISCNGCSHAIVEEGAMGSWKDLPSENWAEMMDFWHCHKPHDRDTADGDHLAKRGYGANNSISAQSGVGFVDLTSFMFSESDCRGISFSSSSYGDSFDMSRLALDQDQSSRFLHVYCKSCGGDIGLYNVLSPSVSLFKWRVSCKTKSPSPPPTSTQCLAASLTDIISRSGSAKSVIFPHSLGPRTQSDQSPSPRALHLWVLNSSVTYSSSVSGGKKYGMKIMFRDISVDEGNDLVDSITSDVQDISFPSSVIEALKSTLESSNLALPGNERSLKEWRVGLLERWSPASL